MRARRCLLVIGMLSATALAGCRETPVIVVRFAPPDLAVRAMGDGGGGGAGGGEGARAATPARTDR